ncbi:rab3 GTPase-activating protein catalytic subunit [Neodiprion pinetum]|uniref:rab3 GTPase-activating protein catalytic subunit n=1 Tax=Neodiprion pinetum TaxID=441929 RepID=UPI001EE0E96E|nr:rab3 GTPase-activating protein catalytic subunit [Neodiprion pinetum]
MNNIEIEDTYHHDFTTASEWEVFIARLEEIIREWKLPRSKICSPLKKGDFINLSWEATSENVHFADVEFSLKHINLITPSDEAIQSSIEECEDKRSQCLMDALNSTNDFASLDQEHLNLTKYYGIREFIILSPAKEVAITDETRIKILLSSITIASNNSNCEVPMFVQVQEPWQSFYLGVSEGRGVCSHFDMVHLKKVPPYCKFLNGLLTLFKQKITEGCGIRLDPAMVSARFTYLLKDWTSSTWTQDPPDFDFMHGETLGVAELGKLPFGATFDPVGELILFTTWPEMPENVVVDSESYTDLEPQQAPEWSVQVKMTSSPACLLGEYLIDFIHLCSNQKTLFELLGDFVSYTEGDGQNLSSAFNALTESRVPALSTVVSKAAIKKTKPVEGPISEDILLPILYFLFPDAEDNPKQPYANANAYNVEDDQWKGVKTAAVDSLVWRLSIVAAHCAHNLGGAPALAHLWHEFVQEIRFRWERNILIPGIGSGFPDSVRTCLLHQKLQMLNCCIERKKVNEESLYKPQSMDIDDPDSDSDEEFFECTNEDSTESEDTGTKRQRKVKHSLWNRPTGRLAKHPVLKLLKTGGSLYLPVTQEPVPKTEDQLEEDAEVMMQLGTDQRASEMRARLMSASLLSDMESFKAANPGAVLEDFIRWYSPRDWIEEEGLDEWGQKNGHLSPRMMIPNNPWSNAWTSSQPVPAHRQKRLFDDTREAEKAIHYLTSQRLGQIAQLLLPVLMHAGLSTLNSQKQEALSNLPDVVQSILSKLQYATKPIHQKIKSYEEIAHDIEGIEALVAQANSLQRKLGGLNQTKEFTGFLVQLMREKEVPVPDALWEYVRSRITSMFYEAQKAAHMMTSVKNISDADSPRDGGNVGKFPAPFCKEFILRAIAPRPSGTSTPHPQRLYASLKRDHLRLAGLFSEDTIFF